MLHPVRPEDWEKRHDSNGYINATGSDGADGEEKVTVRELMNMSIKEAERRGLEDMWMQARRMSRFLRPAPRIPLPPTAPRSRRLSASAAGGVGSSGLSGPRNIDFIHVCCARLMSLTSCLGERLQSNGRGWREGCN